ncbi:uncharacterized protein [Amphiura filiformis]|uniref:uncharacterized protein n=1 Tax=Amphiura filiformis TaxID=82378 RepID=UPI003B20DBE0
MEKSSSLGAVCTKGILLILYLFNTCQLCCSSDPDTAGQEFVFCFPKPFHMTSRSGPPTLLITTPRAVTVYFLVTVPGTSFRHRGSITFNQIATVTLPFDTYLGIKSERYNRTVVVRSPEHPISVQGYHPGTTVQSGFLIIPTRHLGRDYFIANFVPYQYTLFTISAVHEITHVSITLRNGDRSSVRLAPFESYQFLSHSDLTGTHIVADHSVSVVSSCTCAQVPPRFGDCGTLTEHLPSTDRLGQKFIIAPFKGRSDGYMFSILATQMETNIKPIMSNGTSFTLNTGEHQIGDISGDYVTTIEADKPVLVMQYAKGRGAPAGRESVGNPSMSLIPPIEAYSSNLTFPVPLVDHMSVSVTIPCKHSKEVTLDGVALVAPDNLTAGSGFCVLRHSVTPGAHTIGHPSPDVHFMVLVYGFGDSGYSYPAGYNLPTRPCFEASSTLPDIPAEVTKYVQCDDRNMVVYLQRSFIGDGLARHVHANSDCCFGTKVDSNWIQVAIPYYGCGTVREDSSEGILYSNKVVYNAPISLKHPAISRTFTFEIPVTCQIFDRGLGSLGMNPKSHYNVTLHGNKTLGEASFNLQMYHGKQFNDSYKQEEFPVVVNVAETLYLEASVSSIRNVTVAVDLCVATPTKTPEKDANFTFIEAGCPLDESIEFIAAKEKFRQRFSVQAFSFLGNENVVYLHCWMFVCMADDSDPLSRCSRQCTTIRGKRDASKESTRYVEKVITQGPVFLSWKKDQIVQQNVETITKGTNMSILVIGGVSLVLFGVVCGFIIQILRQKFRSSTT